MKEHRWDDRFTAEGVPMTAPTDAGMEGSRAWQYEHQKWKEDRFQKTPEPSMVHT